MFELCQKAGSTRAVVCTDCRAVTPNSSFKHILGGAGDSFCSFSFCPDLPGEETVPEAEACKWEVEARSSKDVLEAAQHKFRTNNVFAAGEVC